MTIRKGQDWGAVGRVPRGCLVAHDDAELFKIVARLAPRDRPLTVQLLGGDLARTLGAAERTRVIDDGDPALLVPIDLGVAYHDGGTDRFAAHAVARRSWWRGSIVGAFNAQFLGGWDVTPRGHPNDGRLDIVEVDAGMGIRQRWAASRRLPTATHVPHPRIATSATSNREWTFDHAQDLYLDGQRIGRTRRLRIDVEPDALTVCIASSSS